MATVHTMLSESEWTPLLLSNLANEVIHSALQALPRPTAVTVNVADSAVQVTPEQAHDLALVINELTTNAMKHALSVRDAVQISVNVAQADDTTKLEMRNDGPDYPVDVLRKERFGTGFDLVENIVHRSLGGELTLHNDHGAVAVIQFKTETTQHGEDSV